MSPIIIHLRTSPAAADSSSELLVSQPRVSGGDQDSHSIARQHKMLSKFRRHHYCRSVWQHNSVIVAVWRWQFVCVMQLRLVIVFTHLRPAYLMLANPLSVCLAYLKLKYALKCIEMHRKMHFVYVHSPKISTTSENKLKFNCAQLRICISFNQFV